MLDRQIQPGIGMSRLTSFLLSLLLLLCFHTAAEVWLPSHSDDDIPDINTARQTFAVDQPELILIDPGQVLYSFNPSLDSIAIFNQQLDMHWQTGSGAVLSFPANQLVWLKLRFYNPQPTRQTWLLELRWPNIDHIDFYQGFGAYDDNHQFRILDVTHHSAGLHTGASDYWRNNSTMLFPVTIDAQEHGDVLLRLESRQLLFAPLYLWPEESFYDYQLVNLSIYALATGMIVALLLYNLALLFYTRDRSYLFYCAYMVFAILYLLSTTGSGRYMIWGEYPWFTQNAYNLGIHGCFLFGTLFVRYFLEIRQHGGWLLFANNFCLYAWGVSSWLLLIGLPSPSWLIDQLAIGTLLIAIPMALELLRRGVRAARYFLLAWFSLIVASLLSIMTLKGYLPLTPLTQYAAPAGFVTESILLAVALAARINDERRLRDEARHRAYALQLEINEKRQQALDSKQRLLEMEKNANRELERKVSERTRELQQLTASLESANRELASLSITDALTGISNRRYFDQHLESELQRARRSHKTLALILVDIDHFKKVNDSWGHPVGDICLRRIASDLALLCQRNGDCIARYGGEEFALILPECSLEDACRRIDQIRVDIASRPVETGERLISINISAGVTLWQPAHPISADILTCQADAALYTAKNNGRNRVVSYDPAHFGDKEAPTR